MSFALCFWIAMLIWLLGGIGYTNRANLRGALPDVLLFLVILLLGWKVFGVPLHA